jgi:hypothetical protein
MGPDISDYAGTVITTDSKGTNKRTWLRPKPLSDTQCGHLALVLIVPPFLGISYVMLSNYPILWLVPIIIVCTRYYRTISKFFCYRP